MRRRWQPGGDLRTATVRIWLFGLWCGAATLALAAVLMYAGSDSVGMDAHAYWLGGRLAHPYGPAPEQADAFLYSPLFAHGMRLVAWLPWPLFCGLFMTTSACVYWWLVRPLTWRWRVPVLLLCVPELMIGNIYAFLAASLVLGLTRPTWWALPALTKVSPAAVGGVWLLARGEWRRAGAALAATAGLAAASFLVEPGLWVEWVRFLLAHRNDGGLEYPVRVAAALLLAAYAARRGPVWLVAVAFYLAMPLAGLGQTLTPLVAIVRLRADPCPDARAGRGQASSRPCSMA